MITLYLSNGGPHFNTYRTMRALEQTNIHRKDPRPTRLAHLSTPFVLSSPLYSFIYLLTTHVGFFFSIPLSQAVSRSIFTWQLRFSSSCHMLRQIISLQTQRLLAWKGLSQHHWIGGARVRVVREVPAGSGVLQAFFLQTCSFQWWFETFF